MRPPFSITDKMLKLTVEITQAVTLLELQHQRDLHLRKENRIRSIHSSLAIEQNTLSAGSRKPRLTCLRHGSYHSLHR